MDNKQQIIEKAEELFLRYGIKSVSMDDIARQLGISKKTLYESVHNKAQLIEWIFERKIKEEKDMMAYYRDHAEDAIDEILKITGFILRTLRKLSPTTVYDLQKYYRSTWKMMEALHHQHYYELIKDNLTRGIGQGVYRPDVDPDIIAKLYVGSSSLVTDEDWFPIQEYRIDELFLQHMAYHLHGIVSPKGLKLLDQYSLSMQQS